MDADADGIARSARTIQARRAARVVPTHCTGDADSTAFRHARGAGVSEGGIGRESLLHGPCQPWLLLLVDSGSGGREDVG